MALATKPLTKCPYCKEQIIEGAIKCKHCHSELKALEQEEPGFFARLNTFRNGFISGIIFMLVLAILAWKHFG